MPRRQNAPRVWEREVIEPVYHWMEPRRARVPFEFLAFAAGALALLAAIMGLAWLV